MGRDPELKYTPGGDPVCKVSIACSEKYKEKEHTEWITCVFWGKLAEVVAKYLNKGALIYVNGKLQTRTWDDKDGVKHSTTEIMARTMKMLGGKGGDQGREPGADSGDESDPRGPRYQDPAPDDDVPF